MKRNGLKRSIIAAVLFALLSGCGAKREPDTADSASPAPAMTAAPAAEGFSVDILSTGKSDCAIIYMDGLVLLSDTADEDDYDQIASKLIADGVSRIDYIILSHYDSDHIGSAAKLIRNFEVGAVLRPDYVEESGEYYALIKAESAANTQTVILGENYYIRTANGVVTVDPPDKDYGDDNNNSAVTLISYRGKNLLFLGDARKKRMEEFLLSNGDAFDFIKLPHHGDGNKALYSLLRRAAPIWAAETISAAEAVEPELLELLDKLGVTLFCTVDGPIRIAWDGQGLTAVQNP